MKHNPQQEAKAIIKASKFLERKLPHTPELLGQLPDLTAKELRRRINALNEKSLNAVAQVNPVRDLPGMGGDENS